MDFNTMFRLKQAWSTFSSNHPRVSPFLTQVRGKSFVPGTEIAVAIRYPDGTEAKTGIRVKQSDLELLQTLQEMGGTGL